MSISYSKENKIFHLKAKDSSYIMKIMKNGQLAHLHWGKPIRKVNNPERLIPLQLRPFESYVMENPSFSLDYIPQEYPAYGTSDFRSPAYQIQLENGTTITNLKYLSHEIKAGKDGLEGLPSTYVENKDEAETLNIELIDELINLKVVLSYTVFKDYSAITRTVRFENMGEKDLRLLRALSCNIDFPDDSYELLQLSGAWARERHIVRKKLDQGKVSIDSKRGASSHQQNPFIALMGEGAGEYDGNVYGFSLVYSGNFLAEVEVNHFKQTRINMGINPFDFNWKLEPGQSFQAPEVVMVYSDSGLNKMSRSYHNIYRKRLIRGKYRDKVRPILLNNWEATYFDFDSEKLLDLAANASDLGIELFVLDDGWFGKRDNDKSSLGDWFVNEEKLPGGLSKLGKEINDMGLDFGLWFEPEMISPVSELYKKHPDWCIHVPGRERSLSRNQLILDYSREEVCDYIIEQISEILNSAPISYVKWDMNRHMTEVGSAELPADRQRETAHHYILGLYYVLEEITSRFPDILFESCSGGGGRFDPGMLYYMPQTWTSDNTDSVERLKIQYGTSIVYPIISIGAHVSAVPNHQVGRITSLEMRGDVAKFGNFGYELDIISLSQGEKESIKAQVSDYKQLRELVQHGSFYRLLSPFEGNETAWMVASENKSQAMVGYYQVLSIPNPGFKYLKLKGLDPNSDYKIAGTDEVYGGDELMHIGLDLSYIGLDISEIDLRDFKSRIWRLERI